MQCCLCPPPWPFTKRAPYKAAQARPSSVRGSISRRRRASASGRSCLLLLLLLLLGFGWELAVPLRHQVFQDLGSRGGRDRQGEGGAGNPACTLPGSSRCASPSYIWRRPHSPLSPLQVLASHLQDVGAVGLAVRVTVAGQLQLALVRVVPRPAHRRNVLQRRVCGEKGQGKGEHRAGRNVAVPTAAAAAAPAPPWHTHGMQRGAPVRPCSRCRSRRYTQALTLRLAGWVSLTPTASTWRTCQRMILRAPAARRGTTCGDVSMAVHAGRRCPHPVARGRTSHVPSPAAPRCRRAPGLDGGCSGALMPTTSCTHCSTGMLGCCAALSRRSRSNTSLLRHGAAGGGGVGSTRGAGRTIER